MVYRANYIIAMLTYLWVVKADTHPDNFLLSLDKDLRRAFRRKSPDDATGDNKKHKKVQEASTKVILEDDYETAEHKFFRTVENVERKVFGVAENLLHDEVDFLFGKDHGHAIHDNRNLSSEEMKKKERGNKKHKKVQEASTKVIRGDDYETAEEKIFHLVENVEKKAVGVAENLLHDEVDILFGKDHGHAIHDNRNLSTDEMKKNDLSKPQRSMNLPLKFKFGGQQPSKVKAVKATKGEILGGMKSPPATSLEEILELYARDVTQQGM